MKDLDKLLTELQEKLTQYAIDASRDIFKIELDFSDESIEIVDEILTLIRIEYNKTKNEELSDEKIPFGFGAYIITVIEKNHGDGNWEKDHPEAGEDSFPFYWKDKVLFPIEWCREHIYGEEMSSVLEKYNSSVLNK